MGKLIHAANTSPEGYLEDETGSVREYARGWPDTDKVVHSTTLAEVSTARTRVEQESDRREPENLGAPGRT